MDFRFALASLWRELLSLIFAFLGTLVIAVFAAAGFVMTAIIWVRAALTGNLINWIVEPIRRKHNSSN